MNYGLKTTDWQVCCVGQAVGAIVVGGGWFLFTFYSANAGGGAWIMFSGGGTGAGGHLSGVVNPDDYGSFSSPWSGMRNIPWWCGAKEFSINDLNGCSGRIASASASMSVVGYSATYATAGDNFYSQSVSGLGFGLGQGIGLGAFHLTGGWCYLRDSGLHP